MRTEKGLRIITQAKTIKFKSGRNNIITLEEGNVKILSKYAVTNMSCGVKNKEECRNWTDLHPPQYLCKCIQPSWLPLYSISNDGHGLGSSYTNLTGTLVEHVTNMHNMQALLTCIQPTTHVSITTINIS